MPSVDDRIVRMEFDNAAFERKISSTITSLGQLDKALKLTGATKGLSDVSAAADKVHFNSIASEIEGVSKKFLAMSTVAITALASITVAALQQGAQIAKGFLGPITQGFQEYETQLNSVQTILANTASKGTTLDQVNDALQRLNTYSDQTIYNFGQMARNIGTFTAAGVDLETSVSSIKGIANLAAMSGSSAEQASTAMYQLSQAIATGSLKLIDWNSVVNAGMGGEAFKSALFETGKAMGTLMDIPAGQTFKEWEDAGNSFRDTLQDGWITADVLTTTLSAFTGDMTEEMLLAKGFNEQQAQAIIKTAAIAKAAATEVKTFTQLVGTVKEAVGTGWADSFKIIIGNFTEAKELWTGVNNSIGAFVQKSSDARNELLQSWKDMGGRELLILSLKTAFQALGEILTPIKEAFRDIFPAVTAENLISLTQAFARFTIAMKPSAETVERIKTIFTGFFAGLSIGWTILKEGTKFIIDLGKSLLGLAGPIGVGLIEKIAGGFTKLQEVLVKGGGIKDFFEGLGKVMQVPIALLGVVRDAIASVFSGFKSDAGDKIGDSFGRLGDRFETLKDAFSKVAGLYEPLEKAFNKVKEILGKIWDALSKFFSELGSKLGEVMKSGEFSGVLDAINTGLFAAIVAMMVKFFKTGLNVDIKSFFTVGGGVFDSITRTFNELTGVLSAMQTQIKANALLKIASAIAVLTASVLVLSMIDSEALTKALTAMAVGFGQLMASFTILSKLASTPQAAASFSLLAAGLILLSGAILILSFAVKSFADMDWDELARGLIGVTVVLGILVVATKPLAQNSKGMIAAGVGIAAMAVGIAILGGAVKIFASMSWEEMAQGLTGFAASLLGIAGAMKLMPKGPQMILIGVGLVAVGIGMALVAGVIAIFGHMKWETIGKGLAAMAGALILIGVAAEGISPSLPVTAAGLILVGFALILIAKALGIMGKMSWDEIWRGLTALGGSLLILAVGLTAMIAAIPGAIALGIAAVGLGLLVAVLKIIGKLSFDDILDSLLKLGLAIGAVAIGAMLLSPAIPALFGLAGALTLLGVGFALFGAGAFLVGKGLEAIAKSGEKAAEAIPKIMGAIASTIPEVLKAIATGIVEMIQIFADAAPQFAEAIAKLLDLILDKLPALIPKLGTVIRTLVEEIFTIIRSYAEQYIELGFFILTKLLEGISNNIENITTVVVDIITKFLDQLVLEIPRIKDSMVNVIQTAMLQAAEGLGEISATILYGTGIAFIEGFFKGLTEAIGPVMTWFGELAGNVLTWIGDVLGTLVQKGVDIITGFWNGIQNFITTVWNFFRGLGGEIAGAVGSLIGTLLGAGREVIDGLMNGIHAAWDTVFNWLRNIADWIGTAVGDLGGVLLDAGRAVINGLKRGAEEVWEEVKGFFSGIADWISEHKGPPEKDAVLLYNHGRLIMEGFHKGLEKEWGKTQTWISNLDPSESIDANLGANMTNALSTAVDQMTAMPEFTPTITPVLDLTEVEKGARRMRDHLRPDKIRPKHSRNQAQLIASTQTLQDEDKYSVNEYGSTGLKFEQNIYSPTRLSTSDIYKQTRNQIRVAKEELKIK